MGLWMAALNERAIRGVPVRCARIIAEPAELGNPHRQVRIAIVGGKTFGPDDREVLVSGLSQGKRADVYHRACGKDLLGRGVLNPRVGRRKAVRRQVRQYVGVRGDVTSSVFAKRQATRAPALIITGKYDVACLHP